MNTTIQSAGRKCGALKRAAMATGILCAMAMSSSLAVAAPMIGTTSFGISGPFNLPAGKNLGNTTAILVTGPVTVITPDTGDLALLVTQNETGTLKSLTNIPGFPLTGIADYLNLNSGVTVDLETLVLDGQYASAHSGGIELSGDVIVNAPGFSATPGFLSFAGTSNDNHTFVLGITISASDPPAQVPEPGTIALLGCGLIGLFLVARRQATADKIG